MKYLYGLCLIVILTSCYTSPRHVVLGGQQISQFAKEVEKTDNLMIVGSGGGFYNGISKFSFTFFSPMAADIESARRLYIDISSRFLQKINEYEEIHCYLYDYPVTIHNLDLHILFYPKVKMDIPTYVDGITMGENAYDSKNNDIYYIQDDEINDRSNIFFKEPYIKAIEIVEQQNNLLQNSMWADKFGMHVSGL